MYEHIVLSNGVGGFSKWPQASEAGVLVDN